MYVQSIVMLVELKIPRKYLFLTPIYNTSAAPFLFQQKCMKNNLFIFMPLFTNIIAKTLENDRLFMDKSSGDDIYFLVDCFAKCTL